MKKTLLLLFLLPGLLACNNEDNSLRGDPNDYYRIDFYSDYEGIDYANPDLSKATLISSSYSLKTAEPAQRIASPTVEGDGIDYTVPTQTPAEGTSLSFAGWIGSYEDGSKIDTSDSEAYAVISGVKGSGVVFAYFESNPLMYSVTVKDNGKSLYSGLLPYGTDIALRTGDTVRAAFDGVVRIAQRNASYGYIVILFHRNGLETYYAHLSKMLVSPCQMVKAGEPIALGGNTGRSRGSHLHLEVRYLGAPLDPQYLIDFGEGKLLRDSLPICKTTLYGVSYSDAMYHKVRQGETLSSIARKYRTSVARIRVLNNMKSTRIRTGSTLRVR